MCSDPEQRVQIVPPCDVVAVSCGVTEVGGGAAGRLVLGLAGRVVGTDDPTGGVVAVGPVDVGRSVEDGALDVVVVRVAPDPVDDGDEPRARSIAPEESRSTPGGATRSATWPTAANATATLAATPITHKPTTISTRRTRRVFPNDRGEPLKRSARRPQA
jgi:hypothetical protein